MRSRGVRILGGIVIAGAIAGGLSGGVAGAAGPTCVPKGAPPNVCVYQSKGVNIVAICANKALYATVIAGRRAQGAVVLYGQSGYGGAVYCSPTTHTYHLIYASGGSTAHDRELRVACLI